MLFITIDISHLEDVVRIAKEEVAQIIELWGVFGVAGTRKIIGGS